MGNVKMENKMNPEVKAKWVAALRSGEYKQGKEYLRDKNNCFCCLGVLYDITDNTRWVEGNWRYTYNAINDEDSTQVNMIAASDMEIFGFNGVPQFQVDEHGFKVDHLEIAWRMNDYKGMSFAEIADYIEANF